MNNKGKLYRIIRIVVIFAIVLIIGYKVTDTEPEETKQYVSEFETAENAERGSGDDVNAVINKDTDTTESTGVKLTENEISDNDGDNSGEDAAAGINPESAGTANDTYATDAGESADIVEYTFRNDRLREQHYIKHGEEMGFASALEYEKAASAVANNPDALHKLEAEDGDDVYYLEATNEFVVVSTDGYIRTYFNPGSGISYYERQ